MTVPFRLPTGNCRNNGKSRSVEVEARREGRRQKRPFEKALRLLRGGCGRRGTLRRACHRLSPPPPFSGYSAYSIKDSSRKSSRQLRRRFHPPSAEPRFHYFSFNFTMRRAPRQRDPLPDPSSFRIEAHILSCPAALESCTAPSLLLSLSPAATHENPHLPSLRPSAPIMRTAASQQPANSVPFLPSLRPCTALPVHSRR